MTTAATHDHTAAVVAWLEDRLGGAVTRVDRQARWRPTWFVDLDRGGELLELVVRAERSDTQLTWPLDHEMRFQSVLHRHGMPVPEVHGWIDEPKAFVMARVPGRPDFAGVDEAERATVVDEYLQALARIHALPVEPFIEAGIDRADRPDESGLIGMRRMVAMYRAQKRHPDPFTEWVLGWVDRHPPASRGREAPVVWDSGQFHHEGGHLKAVIDLELGHLGDPMMDLAAWRMRDSVIPFGDFDELYDRYGELAGAPADLKAIELHHIAFTLSNQLAFGHTIREPSAGTDLATNLQWCNETNLYVTEAIGDFLDVELPTVEMPEPRRSRTGAAHRHLVRSLRRIDTGDDVVRYQVRIAFRLAQHLARVDEIGDALVDADLDDVHALLGRQPASWDEAEAELERFVLTDRAAGAHDEELLALFHRRNLRAQMANGPARSAMARHNPIQRFRRRAAER